MIGILVILIVSWILFNLTERSSLWSLGIFPTSKRLQQLAIGFTITATLCTAVEALQNFLQSSTLQFSGDSSFTRIIALFWWDLKSVLTEELIFRGALLFILIRRLGQSMGLLISAVAFGIYHWFSFGILGSIFPMLVVFIGTGLMGYAWALAFAKTGSIFLPLGLHLGWNFTFNSIFSKGPLGEGILIAEGGQPVSDWYSLVGLWIVPLVLLLIIKQWIPSEGLKTVRKERATMN